MGGGVEHESRVNVQLVEYQQRQAAVEEEKQLIKVGRWLFN